MQSQEYPIVGNYLVFLTQADSEQNVKRNSKSVGITGISICFGMKGPIIGLVQFNMLDNAAF